jgi:hypothetical protein
VSLGTAASFGVSAPCEHFSGLSLTLGERVAWILRLVKTGAEGEGRSVDVMEIHRPDHLGNIADLGLALDETKRLLAGLQQEIVTVQVKDLRNSA